MRRLTLMGVAAVAAVGLLGWAASAGGATDPPPTVGVAWTGSGAVTSNGALPTISAKQSCGSATDTYLAELLHVSPQNAKVTEHWGDVVKGKDMMAAGTVIAPSLGTGDLPFDHTFGSDLNFNLQLDAPYLRLGQAVNGSGDGGAGTVHIELSEGLLPHDARAPGPASGMTWQDMSDASRVGIMDGFVPQPGDRAVVMGRWIIDCGHGDFGTELHPITFLAFGRTVGTTTTVHFFANPYRDTQRYNLDTSLANHVNDASRLTRADTYPFPQGLVAEVIDIIQGKTDHLIAPEMLEANTQNPVPWQVCAPDGASGAYPAWQSHVSVRPNVTFSIDPVPGTRCVSITSTRAAGYATPDPRLRTCQLPWAWLNTQAAGEAGVANLDVKQLIKDQVPQQYWPAIDKDPTSICFDSLTAKPITSLDGKVVTDPSQAFPFVGEVSVGASDTPPPTTTTTTTAPTSTAPTTAPGGGPAAPVATPVSATPTFAG